MFLSVLDTRLLITFTIPKTEDDKIEKCRLQIWFHVCFYTSRTALRIWDKIPTLTTNTAIFMHFEMRSEPYGAPVTAQCTHLNACNNLRTSGRCFIKTDTEEFEVPIAMVKNSSTFWDKTPCNLLKIK